MLPDRDSDGKPDSMITIASGLVMPDGSHLVPDDQAGAIYRISYRSP